MNSVCTKGSDHMTKINDIHYLYDTNNNLELIICNNSQISYPLHCHVSVYTIGMILEGTISLCHNHSLTLYHKGDTFSILPYMPHCIQSDNNYTLLSLCIPKEIFNNCHLEKIHTNISDLLFGTLIPGIINQKQISHIRNCLSSFEKHNALLKLKSSTSSIEILKQQLELFPEIKFSVDEMAHAAYLSKYQFIRNFKREVGLTPHQFQIQNRIRKAQRLISNSETITEVALTTGFCDQSHFIRHFEKYVGLTPTTYKMSCDVFSHNADC